VKHLCNELIGCKIQRNNFGLAKVLHLTKALVMCQNFEILTAIEKLKILSYECSDADRIAINSTIDILKQVDNYCSKSIFDFTTEDFDFDARGLFSDIKDYFPEMSREIQASKTLAIDLADQKRLQLPSLKTSLQSMISRLDEFAGNYQWRRRCKYDELIIKIDEVLDRNKWIHN